MVSPGDSLSEQVDGVRQLLEGRSVACAESCTAGLLAQALAGGDGASKWFLGGVVTYQRDSKRLLGVAPGPVVTTGVAEQMAIGVAGLFGSDVAVSTTGAAGPSGLDGAPPGTVVLGWYIDGDHGAETLHVPGDPPTVCHEAARYALALLTTRLAHRAGATSRSDPLSADAPLGPEHARPG